MFDRLAELYQIDWRIFMTATQVWLRGGQPYGRLTAEFGPPGAFAYPPTALTWLSVFVPLGAWSFYVWTGLELLGWWLLIRQRCRSQIVLLFWAPVTAHLVLGQSTLAVVLVLWAAFLAPRRGWLWGLALAWTLTKPQVALIPCLWLLWQDRASPLRWRLWAGIVLGTVLLALPPTLMNPHIWHDWILSLSSYGNRNQQSAPWQGWGLVVLTLATYLWQRSHRSHWRDAGWQWWLPVALFPQGGLYSSVTLLPALRPHLNYWSLAGLALSGVLQGPVNTFTLPLILSGQMLTAWMICGGPSLSSTGRRRP